MSILKILGLSDIHYQEPLAINKIIDFLNKEIIDLVVVSGDLTTFGSAKAVKKVLTELNQIKKPILYIQGNMDSKDSGDFSFENIIPLHGRVYNFAGYNFVGVGGSTKTPIPTPYTMSESTLKKFLEETIKKLVNKDPIVLISHTPPLKSDADKLSNGKHVGSSSVREFIDQFKPIVVLCGHIHESQSISLINSTLCINPGPFREGNAVVIELLKEKEQTVKSKGKLIKIK